MIHTRQLAPDRPPVAGLRRAVIELLVCCGIAALWYASRLPPDSANARDPFWPSLIFGVLATAPLWIPYRIIRFAIGR